MSCGRRAFVGVSRAVFNGLYRLCSLGGRHNEVLFLSRQTNQPSNDYRAVGEALAKRGFTPVYLCRKLSKRTVFPYAAHALREIRHLACCKVVFIDRYDPMVSLIDFNCEPISNGLAAAARDSRLQGDVLHVEYPAQPMVIQLWHAFGAFKKFGYQSIGTREGHSHEVADAFDIHRNYSWVVCSGEGCRAAFAEAFAIPVNRVVPLNRPEYRDIMLRRPSAADTPLPAEPSVLFAPTLRKSSASPHPFRTLYDRRKEALAGVPIQALWSFHPLEEGLDAVGQVPASLDAADYVVTDYSSIVYESYLLGKRVVFFVPDLDEYRKTPGLNADPGIRCPELTAVTEADLRDKLMRWTNDPATYPAEQLEAFIDGAFAEAPDDPAKALADFVCQRV